MKLHLILLKGLYVSFEVTLSCIMAQGSYRVYTRSYLSIAKGRNTEIGSTMTGTPACHTPPGSGGCNNYYSLNNSFHGQPSTACTDIAVPLYPPKPFPFRFICGRVTCTNARAAVSESKKPVTYGGIRGQRLTIWPTLSNITLMQEIE